MTVRMKKMTTILFMTPGGSRPQPGPDGRPVARAQKKGYSFPAGYP